MLDCTESGIGCVSCYEAATTTAKTGPVIAIGAGAQPCFATSPPHAVSLWHRSQGTWSNQCGLVFERGAVMPVHSVSVSTSGRYIAAVGASGSSGLRGTQRLCLSCRNLETTHRRVCIVRSVT